jgi:hypothetical protein
MNVHKNARLTPSVRALLADRVERGWTARCAAKAAGVSLRTARKCLVAYTEIPPSEGQHDTTAFLERALAWLNRHGVSVECVMTDNGSAYRSSDERAKAIAPWTESYNLNRPHSASAASHPGRG